MENVVIVGSGPAGLTAAIYASRANLNPLVITGTQIGGQLIQTSTVENFPGFEEGILGPELMTRMQKQAERFGSRFIYENVIEVNFDNPNKKILITESGREIASMSVIIATGSSPKWLGVEGEREFVGKGVSTCATCDGAFFRNKVVAVVGGGDSAMEESLFLSKLVSKTYIIHRRNEFRASKIMQERVFATKSIEVLWNTVVTRVNGSEKLESVDILINSQEESKLKIDGLFIAIGHNPNTDFLRGKLELDENGYIKTYDTNQTHTSVDGVFVAGDAFDHWYRQAITAAGSGCKAALEVEKYLTQKI